MRVPCPWTKGYAGVGRDVGHLGENQTGPAQRARTEVDQMEVVDQTVLGRIHAHRRDHDAVGQGQAAQLQRREHGRGRRFGRRRAGAVGEPALDPGQEVTIAQTQVLMADALAAGQQAVGELQRVEVDVAVDRLEPFGRIARRALQFQHLDPALGLIGREGEIEITATGQGPGQMDGVLEGQFGPGPDGEMRGVGGVPQQDDLAVAPVGTRDAREVEPGRAADVSRIAHQGVTTQPVGEQGFGRTTGLILVELIEAEAKPGRLGAFDDEGRGSRFELVGVGPDPTVRGVDEGEGEGVERLMRAQPDVFVGAHVDVDAEGLGPGIAGHAVQPVGGNHDVSVKRPGVRDLGLKPQLDAQGAGPVM